MDTFSQRFYFVFQSKPSRVLVAAIVFSLLLHSVMLFFKIKAAFVANPTTSEEQVVKIKFQTMPEASKSQERKLQIVETVKNANEVEAQDSRFLGEKNNHADRQSVAKVVDKFNVAGKGNENAKEDKEQQAVDTKAKKNDKSISLKDLRMKHAVATLNEFKQPAKASSKKGLKNGNEKNKGLSSSNDFIEEIPLGDFTILNTTEFKYYGFYHRIKQKLEQFWGQSIQEKVSNIYKMGRRLPAGENHMTALIIKLNSEGQILKVTIKNTSGVRELDDAAIDSFNRAGPFPNPPKGMIKNGYAVIEWGFVVKT